MDKKELLLSGYEITGDENFSKELNPIPHSLDFQLNDLYELALKGKKSAVKKFIRLIEKYPRVPMLKNYLSVLYSNLGLPDKAFEVNRWIVAEHPDYLFGKLNLAAEYFTKEEFDKIPEVLGKYMELKKLYPNRNKFHVVEVSGFFKISVLYFSAIGDLEQAEIRLDFMRELVPDSEDLETAEKNYSVALMAAAIKNMGKAKEDLIDVEVKKTELTNVKTPPKFTNKEIGLLYEMDFIPDKKQIEKILSLPRKSLINDLNLVLKDTIIRYNYFRTEAESERSDNMTFNFLIHSLFVLSEIEATESIENIFEVLRQDTDYFDFYLGDILTEFIWLVLYKTAYLDLDKCKQFMFEPGIYTFSKTSVSEIVSQIALHHPDRKKEVTEWFRDVFKFFIKSTIDDNVIDSNLFGILVDDVIDFDGIELMPEIEELYKKKIVDLQACGDIKEVKKLFIDEREINNKKDILSIFDIYNEIDSWGNADEHSDNDTPFYDDEEENLTNSFYNNEPIVNTNKVGRNDPCPCGSGKKYKKCCINK